MSGKETIRNGIILVAILIGAGLLTAVWPALTNTTTTQQSTQIPVEAEVIQFTLPDIGGLGGDIQLTSIQAMGIMAGLVIAPVVVIGIVLAFVAHIAANQALIVQEQEKFEQKDSGILYTLFYRPLSAVNGWFRERANDRYSERETQPMPAHKMPRWSALSTALIFLLFAVFFGYLVNGTFVPEGEIILANGTILRSAIFYVGGAVLLTLLILIWRLRPRKFESLEAADNSAIPWDFIWVLISGLLVLGLGLGLIVYFNVPL